MTSPQTSPAPTWWRPTTQTIRVDQLRSGFIVRHLGRFWLVLDLMPIYDCGEWIVIVIDAATQPHKARRIALRFRYPSAYIELVRS